MDQQEMEARIKNIDERTERIEQILPTLATKDELHEAVALLATKEELRKAVEPLATKEELRKAVEPLATKEELRKAVEPLATKEQLREEGERTRRHFDVIAESLREDIKLIAEGHDALEKRMTRLESAGRTSPL